MRAADRHQEGMLSHSSERGSRESHYREKKKVANHGTNPTSLARQRSPSEVFHPVIKTLPVAELFRDVLEDDFEVS